MLSVEENVYSIIRDVANLSNIDNVSRYNDIKNIGCSSLEIMTIIIRIEEYYNIEFDDEIFEKQISNVGYFISYIERVMYNE